MIDIRLLYAKKSHVKDPDILLGAKILTADSEGISSKEIYIGTFVSLNEVVENPYEYGINFPHVIAEKYASLEATGFVYFPQNNSYGFLQENDELVSNEEELMSILYGIKNKTNKIDNPRVRKFVSAR